MLKVNKTITRCCPLMHATMSSSFSPWIQIPWALRDVIADDQVAHFFADEIVELRDAFRDWHPKTTILRDIKKKLQPIQRLPSSIVKGSSRSLSRLWSCGHCTYISKHCAYFRGSNFLTSHTVWLAVICTCRQTRTLSTFQNNIIHNILGIKVGCFLALKP